MSKIKYILFSVIGLLILTFIAVFYISNNQSWLKNTGVDLSIYKPYVLNTEIDFSKKGKSFKYINMKDGWGGQQPKWRISLGNESIIRLYIKDGKNKKISLHLTGWGVYNHDKDEFQRVVVFANDKNIGEWKLAENKTYSIIIPSDIMQSNILVIRFDIKKPRLIENTNKKTGMAVTKLQLKKQSETKIKIAKWLKNAMN